ncbi:MULTISPECIES: hypothetical protein [Thermoanaerobacter]|jgi:hypothetical protein|uniref:Uncharacterized protein n=1 Tax=Thermoanaerobacter pentosaceus TaxID=694059 RepID=A0ABT9M1S0_9THEO|nr:MULTISPECIES: hypothetical protein [Thermoanaerobacter]MDP9750049.1 hypothetical protein [Thermoanaerobacter pentosaceus]
MVKLKREKSGINLKTWGVSKSHPKYVDFIVWGTIGGYRDFDIEMINRELKTLWP